MHWKTELPTEPGFYYWQNHELRAISDLAVRVVYVGKYRNRDGFNAATLHHAGDRTTPYFDCDLARVPGGRWSGPLPQPY